MATVVTGTFSDRAAAREAVERLRVAGVPATDILTIVRDTEAPGQPAVTNAAVHSATAASVEGEEAASVIAEETDAGPSAAAKGAQIGGISGLLIGLGALILPGSAPIAAAGALVGALASAVVGAAAGGLVGALVDLGVPEEHARIHAADVQRGHLLLVVRTDAVPPAQVREIMAQTGASNLHPAVSERSG